MMRRFVLFCGICGMEVHVTRGNAIPFDWVTEAERACEEHLTAEHPWRYWLWKRLGWRWLVAGLAP